jgi:Fe-S-cluster containining protein
MPFYDNGLRFECQRCSACCRFDPGIVRLKAGDEEALLHYLKVEKPEFEEKYCRPGVAQDGRPELWLKEKAGYDCIFWEAGPDGGGCAVYPARPAQCRTWPFWPSLRSEERRVGKECVEVG